MSPSIYPQRARSHQSILDCCSPRGVRLEVLGFARVALMYQPKLPKDLRCPLEFALEFFSGRWKSRILCLLYSEESVRYNDIKKALVHVSDTVLANTLKELIGHDLVRRRQFPEIPPRVEYSLTDKGKSLVPYLRNICRWSSQYHDFNTSSEDALSHCRNCVVIRRREGGRPKGECPSESCSNAAS